MQKFESLSPAELSDINGGVDIEGALRDAGRWVRGFIDGLFGDDVCGCEDN